MHAAWSVIAFTVLSGAGFGLSAWLAVGAMMGWEHRGFGASWVLSLVLVVVGLLCSTQHLANPKNVWRAFFRIRTSWLSREGLLAVVYFPFMFLMGASVYWGWFGAGLWAFVTVVLSILTVFSTGMIYACLKPIRQWHTKFTPLNYLTISAFSGGLLWQLSQLMVGQPAILGRGLFLVCLLAVVAKILYYGHIRVVRGPTINTATGLSQAAVRLLDAGHSSGTFLTKEFAEAPAPELIAQIKILSLISGFAVPSILVLLAPQNVAAIFLAVLCAGFGLMLERWLFFKEAKHVVNLYHGEQHT